MRSFAWWLGGVMSGAIVIAATLAVYVHTTGLDSRAQPGSFEARLARLARRLAVPGEVKSMRNPVNPTPDVLAEGLAHFADHCAIAMETTARAIRKWGAGCTRRLQTCDSPRRRA